MPDPIVVPHVQQVRANWCWAACAEMLVRRCGGHVSQAVFAALHNARYHHGMDHQADPNELAYVLNNFGGLGRSVEAMIHVHPYNAPRPTWGEVCAALDRCQMLIVGSANHARLVVGYGTTWGGQQFLWVHDPALKEGPVRIAWAALNADWRTTVMMTRMDLDTLD